MSKTKTYEPHELALVFPPMTPGEIETLAESIKRSGLREEIILHEGKILDGRNRYQACADAGVKPRFRDFGSDPADGASATRFVNDKNLERRNLTKPGQKAALGAKLLPFFKAEAELNGGDAMGKAAAASGVSRSYVADAAALQKDNPEQFAAVAAGTTTLPDAVRTAAEEKAASKAAKAAEAKAIRDLKRDHSAEVKELHGEVFADAFDKGVILKKLDELKLFLKQSPSTQIAIEPLIRRQYTVKSAIKMMTGELCGEDTIETLICRAIAHKGAKQFKIDIDGHTITVRKSVEGAD